MFLAVLTLANLLRECAPNVSPATMAAIVRVESGGNPLAIHDNTLGRSFMPSDTNEAVAWTNQLLGLGHSVDLGLSQINSTNLGWLGLSVARAFDPCANVHAGGTILGNDYGSAVRQFGAGQYALRRAIGAYNTGSIFAGQEYVNAILAAAGLTPDDAGPPAALAAAPLVAARIPASAIPQARASKKRAGIPGASPVAEPAYTVQHTPGSPVVVLVGS